MKLFILFFLFFVFHSTSYGQDERFFRKIFTDELHEKEESPAFKIKVATPSYNVDLDRDGVAEKIVALKKDGLDFFQILDRSGATIFEAKLDAKGVESVLYKAHLKTLSKNVDALILYFDEGNSGSTVFQSTARIYILTIENRNLKTVYFERGPAFFYEKETMDFFYARRHYNVNVIDYNKDGVKEVSVSYNKIQRILFYKGKGRWSQL